MMKFSFFLILAISLLTSACISERALVNPKAPLGSDLKGRFESPPKYQLPQGKAEFVGVEIWKDSRGQYAGRIERKILHEKSEEIFLIHYKGELYNALTSGNEIIFHDRIESSCRFGLREESTAKNTRDLNEADFKLITCYSKEHLQKYNERERQEEFGSIYFKVLSENEIHWFSNPTVGGIPLQKKKP